MGGTEKANAFAWRFRAAKNATIIYQADWKNPELRVIHCQNLCDI
jgi:hypothetical protein